MLELRQRRLLDLDAFGGERRHGAVERALNVGLEWGEGSRSEQADPKPAHLVVGA